MGENLEDGMRAVESRDLDRLLEWRNHEDIRSFMFNRHPISAEEHRRWFERESANHRVHLLVYERDGSAVGYVRFQVTTDGGTAEWGFYAAPGASPGTGRALGIAALRHAFGTLSVHKVSGQALEFNAASIRFHERLGFKQEGRLREHHFDGQRYHDILCFGLLDYEWEVLQHAPND